VARARWLSPFASRSRFTRRPIADGAIRIEFYSPVKGQMLLLSSARTAARWTASAAVFSQAEPVRDMRECSLPVTTAIRVLDQREVVPLAVHARHHVADSPTRPR
jgi:hypothetical protein